MKHTARIMWIIGQTEVELISSANNGCICCISSFPGLSIVVGLRKDVIQSESDSRLWQLPGQARPTLPLSSHAHPAPDDGDDDADKRKVGAAVRRQDLQCRLLLCPGLLTLVSPPSIVISQRDNRPQVYECMVRGIAVMRRRADSYVNATQILKVAGVEKGRRTKILEKEILPGKHEIVQGGYGKYQGTWYVPIFFRLNLSLTSATGFLLSEVKNWPSATVWPLYYRPYLTSSRLPLRGTHCHRCQVKPSPPSPLQLPGHYLRRRRSRVWGRQTTTAPAA